MPRSVGPGGPRATAEPLDQVLIVLVMFEHERSCYLEYVWMDGWRILRIQSKAFFREQYILE